MPKANWRDDLDFELGINFAAWFWFFSVVMAHVLFIGRIPPSGPEYQSIWFFATGTGMVSLIFAFMPIVISASEGSKIRGLSIAGRILYIGSNLMILLAVVLGKSHPFFTFWLCMSLWSFVGGLFFRVWWRKLTAEGEDNG